FVLVPQGSAAAAPAPAGAPGARPASAPPPSGAGLLRWPLANVARSAGSPFGARDGRAHEGIDLPAPTGTPVLAAADGEVVYAGSGIRGYGNLVVLQHPGDMLTVYAHNSELFVPARHPVPPPARTPPLGQPRRPP